MSNLFLRFSKPKPVAQKLLSKMPPPPHCPHRFKKPCACKHEVKWVSQNRIKIKKTPPLAGKNVHLIKKEAKYNIIISF